MKTVDQIRKQLTNGEFSFSHHAFRRAVERNISEAEICQAGTAAEIIEAYPIDKYSASCLLTALKKPQISQMAQIFLSSNFASLRLCVSFFR